jgi:hypothetical protein
MPRPSLESLLLSTRIRNTRAFDLVNITVRALRTKATRNHDKRSRRRMNHIVDEIVEEKIDDLINDLRTQTPPVEDDVQLIIDSLFRFRSTFMGEAEIHTISLMLRIGGLTSYYTETAIRDYIVRQFNSQNRAQHGLWATVSENDILVLPDPEMSPLQRKEALRSLKS